jgi:hypothetical protein
MRKYVWLMLLLITLWFSGCSTPEKGWEGTKTINQIPSTYQKETGMVTSRFPDYTVSFKLPDGYEPVETGSKEEQGPVFQDAKKNRYFGIKVMPKAADFNAADIQKEIKKQFNDTKILTVSGNPGTQVNIDPSKNGKQAMMLGMDQQSLEKMKDYWISMNVVYTNTHMVRLDMTGLREDKEMPQVAESIMKSMQIQRN